MTDISHQAVERILKREINDLQIELDRASGALADAATVPAGNLEAGIRELTRQRDALQQRLDDVNTKDSVKTQEINLLTKENRTLQRRVEALERAAQTFVDDVIMRKGASAKSWEDLKAVLDPDSQTVKGDTR